jgi:hypothetical protein
MARAANHGYFSPILAIHPGSEKSLTTFDPVGEIRSAG